MIPIGRPLIGEEEQRAVAEALASGHLIQGPRVAEFEERFAAYHRVGFGVATNNGTSALTAALMAHGIGPGDLVLVPSFTFFASASSILSVGARPVFVDIEPDTFCMSPAEARKMVTRDTKAIVAVHLYGHPAAMDEISELCRERNLALIEDAAQAHGAAIDTRPVGSWGTACFSFYPSKNMTTTEGGMVLTNDEALASRLRMIRNQGMNVRYQHEILGYNLRMTDPCAAIGLVQLKKLPQWNEQRRANAEHYHRALDGVRSPLARPHHTHVFHQYTVRLPGGVSRGGLSRDAVVEALNRRGIGARVYYPKPIHRQPVFAAEHAERCLPETDRAVREVFSLPVHPSLSNAELDEVIGGVNELC